MFLTNVLLKKIKSKHVMVLLKSTASNHTIVSFRERVANKKEAIYFDPYVEMECVYKEFKKIRSVKEDINIKEEKSAKTYGIIPKELEMASD